MARIHITDLPVVVSEGEAGSVVGGVPNAGVTTTVIIQTGDAIVKNNAEAIRSSTS